MYFQDLRRIKGEKKTSHEKKYFFESFRSTILLNTLKMYS